MSSNVKELIRKLLYTKTCLTSFLILSLLFAQTSGLRRIRNAENEEPQEYQTEVSNSFFYFTLLTMKADFLGKSRKRTYYDRPNLLCKKDEDGIRSDSLALIISFPRMREYGRSKVRVERREGEILFSALTCHNEILHQSGECPLSRFQRRQ